MEKQIEKQQNKENNARVCMCVYIMEKEEKMQIWRKNENVCVCVY